MYDVSVSFAYASVYISRLCTVKGGELNTDPLLDGTARSRIAGDFSSLLLSYLIVSTLEIDICSHSPLLSKHAII